LLGSIDGPAAAAAACGFQLDKEWTRMNTKLDTRTDCSALATLLRAPGRPWRLIAGRLVLAAGIAGTAAAFAAEQYPVTEGSPGYGTVARPDRTTSGPQAETASAERSAFPQIDGNSDGHISQQELSGWAQTQFSQWDRDGDKGLSPDELTAMMGGATMGATAAGAAGGQATGSVGQGGEAAATGTGESAAETTGSVGGDGSVGSRQSPR
jgi:hypothetical protein